MDNPNNGLTNLPLVIKDVEAVFVEVEDLSMAVKRSKVQSVFRILLGRLYVDSFLPLKLVRQSSHCYSQFMLVIQVFYNLLSITVCRSLFCFQSFIRRIFKRFHLSFILLLTSVTIQIFFARIMTGGPGWVRGF